jgi:hypothetical protein
MKSLTRMLVFVMLFWISGAVAQAEETAQAPAMDPEKAAQMEKMMAFTAPGEAHKVLEPLAGKWTYTSKMWMTPDSPIEESTGTSQDDMIYGGRFLMMVVKGTMMGKPFEGLGFTGYDNIKKEYVSVWLDGMATGLMTSSGQYDAATKTFTETGVNSCPLTGEKDRKGRTVTTLVDNDHKTYTAYSVGPDGKENKLMEIAFTRVPQAV